jgi:GxxExxY protein
MEKIIQKSETYHMIGMCMEIHRELGFGFSEIVYKDALETEAVINDFLFKERNNLKYFIKENRSNTNSLLILLCLII